MTNVRSVLFAWNGEPLIASFFLEESLEEWRTSGLAASMIIDCGGSKGTDLPLYVRESRDIPARSVKYLERSSVLYCRADFLPNAIDEMVRKKHSDLFDGKTFFLVANREQYKEALDITDEILYFVEKAPDSFSRLYTLVSSLEPQRAKAIRIGIVVSNEYRIEEAAAFFLELRDEIDKLMSEKIEFYFLGMFSIDQEKMNIIRTAGRLYHDLYACDAMYGMIRYIGRRWVKALEFQENPPVLADFAKNAASLAE